MSQLFFVLVCGIAGLDLAQQANAEEVVVPVTDDARARYELPGFYKKMVAAEGVPVFSSERPADAALLEAKRLIDRMLADRPKLVGALLAADLRVTVMATDEFSTDVPEHSQLTPKAYWDRRARGLGGTIEIPVVSCGEENLLHLEGDPYHAENILVHEFAHSVHLVGMVRLLPDFDSRLKAAYESAQATKLWRDTYAISNHEEYFAEGTQTWFECNNNSGPIHGKVKSRDDLQAYDPALAALLNTAYGANPWRYDAHGHSERTAGASKIRKRFSWPPELRDATDVRGRFPGSKGPDD